MSRTLVFFPTYNEVGNVGPLVQGIRSELPAAHILVVDDASTDGTGQALDRLAELDERLEVIHRPRKMGVGTAHKLALLYARRHGFDALLVMDADFSHHPRYLPVVAKLLEENEFVTGSRYCPGGRCDYGFYRQLISRSANTAARWALGMPLRENTTLFRGFRRSLLERLDVDAIRSEGYSFAVESLFRIGQLTRDLAEFPIHFADRELGVSKISKVEIFRAVRTVGRLFVRRLLRRGATPVSAAERDGPRFECKGCGYTYHVTIHDARDAGAAGGDSASGYGCATLQQRAHDRIRQCLACGLVFMPPRLEPGDLLEAYAAVEDPNYLDNLAARETTFRYNLRAVRRFVSSGDRVLEVGSYCGAFLKVAQEQGIDITGLEPSRWAVKAARRVTRAPVYEGTLADLPAEAGSFDAIVSWDVLEHFSDPLAELCRMNRRLHPGGVLAFSTIMIDSWFARLLGRRWPWYMDMHLFYFSEQTLGDLLERSGFSIAEARPYCHVVTLAYLLQKLGTLGVPLAARAGTWLASTPLGSVQIPFRFGDIKLFVCLKQREASTA